MALPPTRHAEHAPGAGVAVVDYRGAALTSAPAGADGTALVLFPPVDPGRFWLVDRLAVSTTSTTTTTARVYLDQPAAAQLVNATPAGNLDIDDSNSPLMVDASSSLLIAWDGASAGATATARIQYRLMQRTG